LKLSPSTFLPHVPPFSLVIDEEFWLLVPSAESFFFPPFPDKRVLFFRWSPSPLALHLPFRLLFNPLRPCCRPLALAFSDSRGQSCRDSVSPPHWLSFCIMQSSPLLSSLGFFFPAGHLYAFGRESFAFLKSSFFLFGFCPLICSSIFLSTLDLHWNPFARCLMPSRFL